MYNWCGTHVVVESSQFVAEGDDPEEHLLFGLVLGLVRLHQRQERLRLQRHLWKDKVTDCPQNWPKMLREGGYFSSLETKERNDAT